jgi:hypothetical protein
MALGSLFRGNEGFCLRSAVGRKESVMRYGPYLGGLVVSLGVLGASSASAALSMGDSILHYDSGGNSYNISSSALGLPEADAGDGYILTPFNAAWQSSDLTGISAGGNLVLQLSSPIRTDGRTLGIHAGVGLADVAWPGGVASQPAASYNSLRQASISVSDDGDVWASLGLITFELPTNYYSQGVSNPGYTTVAGTKVADFSRPFLGTLGDFDGKDWPQILTLLDGSGGGTWLDLSKTGLSQVNYVKFDVGTGQQMYVDSVVGVAVPEPGAVLILLGAGLLGLRRRRGA